MSRGRAISFRQLLMETFFHNNTRLVFWIISFLLLIIGVAYGAYTISFIHTAVTQTYGNNLLENQESVTFNLEKARSLRK